MLTTQMPLLSCASPGKIMVAGEYAVVDGGPAILMAVDRKAVATVRSETQQLSPFLTAAENVIKQTIGTGSREAHAAQRISVSTTAFRHSGRKVGLGSSAATTVAAIGAALATSKGQLDKQTIYRFASQAHGDAQSQRGSRGSGADIACCVFGGTILYKKAHNDLQIREISLVSSLHLVFPWTGIPASTAPLLRAVQRFQVADPTGYRECCTAISNAAMALADAPNASDAVATIGRAGEAVKCLGDAARIQLWIPAHNELAAIATDFGGTLKPTGAGGGDLALAAFSSAEAARGFSQIIKKRGIYAPSLHLDTQGVRLLL